MDKNLYKLNRYGGVSITTPSRWEHWLVKRGRKHNKKKTIGEYLVYMKFAGLNLNDGAPEPECFGVYIMKGSKVVSVKTYSNAMQAESGFEVICKSLEEKERAKA